MIEKLPLRQCKLWWPAWQQGIPFDSYGYRAEISGDGYRFTVDPEMDSWLCPSGNLMPISGATLKSCSTMDAISYLSFSIIGGRVQVNRLVGKHNNEYVCTWYDIDDLYFEGFTYCDND